MATSSSGFAIFSTCGEISSFSRPFPDVFTLNQPRGILVSHDGSNLSVYIDGKRDPRSYELTPGAPLAQLIRHIKTNELEGYTYIYYLLVFFPGGVLFGLAARRLITLDIREMLVLVLATVMPSIFLEMLLVRISGRAFSLFNVFLSALVVIAALIWVNADRPRPQAVRIAIDHK